MEGIFVELADEGGELIVFEVLWKDVEGEWLLVMDDEGGSGGCPLAEVVCGGVRDESVELGNEGSEKLFVLFYVGGRRVWRSPEGWRR